MTRPGNGARNLAIGKIELGEMDRGHGAWAVVQSESGVR